ncbi:MAG: FtsW/RodA/SpoVE family cell cycle protein [Anaerolineales bacterium]
MNVSQPLRRWLPASTSISLLRLAAVFLSAYALALTLSPAVRDRSFDGLSELRWAHWLGVIVWMAAFFLLDRSARRTLPNRDPLIVPLAGLLSGWGLLTVWRLFPFFGYRQTLWLAVSAGVFILALRYKDKLLNILRRYKYLWLLAGFIITALTFLFGTNPSGIGPELWLGCCGVYFQPSEILKLLLVIYLAAYLADRQPLMQGLTSLLAPTALMTGFALLLLLVQQDLGTAWVFIFIYTILIFAAAGRRRVLLASLLILILALFAGYELVNLVQLRIEAWLNPWIDPSGSAYQIVQGLLALASGGIFGRGPGLGSPDHVPVPHSDFVYTSIVEESGLFGAIGLLLLITLLSIRALRISLHARDAYQRYLAIGVGAYLASQSLLIIGGNIRMLPLTGVTLPFVSYGGSSLLTSFVALLLLCLISNEGVNRSARLLRSQPTLLIAGILMTAFGIAALISGWWAIVRGPDLLTRNDNVRRSQSDLYVPRGALLDRYGTPISETIGEAGNYQRQYLYPQLSSVLGYSHPNYGQAGLEAGLDPILRGEQYQPTLSLWLNHVLYGLPSPGLDIRLSLDLELELMGAELLEDETGAAVLLDVASGEMIAIVSQPGYDANTLGEDWESLLASESSPLLNRATQGAYPPGTALGPFLLAASRGQGLIPTLPSELSFTLDEQTLHCLREPIDDQIWDELIAAACPGALAELGIALGGENLLALFDGLGFYTTPALPFEMHAQALPISIERPGAAAVGQGKLRVSPLQMAYAVAALSNFGQLPAGQMVLKVEQVGGGWLEIGPTGEPVQALHNTFALSTAQNLANPTMQIWEVTGQAMGDEGQIYTWYLAGTLPNENEGSPERCVVILLESDDPALARSVGQTLLMASLER